MTEGSVRGALPKYIQISEMLIRRIGAGLLADGARLPPERDLALSLGISVGTLRKALADLAAKGLLERRQGSGNYVRNGPVSEGRYAFFRLERVGGGGLPTAQVLDVVRLPKPGTGSAFGPAPVFGPAPDAHRIRRLRRLDGVVVALEEIWLDASYSATIAADDLSESLYLFYSRTLGLVITRIEDQVGIGHVPDWAPPGFPLAVGHPVGHIERIGWAQTGQGVEYSQTWFDPDNSRYISRLQKGK